MQLTYKLQLLCGPVQQIYNHKNVKDKILWNLMGNIMREERTWEQGT